MPKPKSKLKSGKSKNLIMVTMSDELRNMFDKIKDPVLDKDVDVVRRLIKQEYDRKKLQSQS